MRYEYIMSGTCKCKNEDGSNSMTNVSIGIHKNQIPKSVLIENAEKAQCFICKTAFNNIKYIERSIEDNGSLSDKEI